MIFRIRLIEQECVTFCKQYIHIHRKKKCICYCEKHTGAHQKICLMNEQYMKSPPTTSAFECLNFPSKPRTLFHLSLFM